ncbi:MAG: hypothetical protein JW839_05265 [Candidatus Lokiarchaeota archaeon]|nr:hypothetical protein [Candidatus Lokiarchaeota archaeon]
MSIKRSFAFDDPGSFHDVRAYSREICRARPGRVPVIIAGTKCDLAQAVGEDEMARARERGGWPCMRTSAKTGEGVPALFVRAAAMALE